MDGLPRCCTVEPQQRCAPISARNDVLQHVAKIGYILVMWHHCCQRPGTTQLCMSSLQMLLQALLWLTFLMLQLLLVAALLLTGL